MDNQTKDLKLEKDKKLSQTRKEKTCQKRSRKCKKKRKQALAGTGCEDCIKNFICFLI